MTKLAFQILAWFGLIILGISLPFSFSSSLKLANPDLSLGSGVGYVIVFFVGWLAVVLGIGGMITRSPLYWIGTILGGIIYISSFYGYFFYFASIQDNIFSLGLLLPGIFLIVEGIIQRTVLQKRGSQNK